MLHKNSPEVFPCDTKSSIVRFYTLIRLHIYMGYTMKRLEKVYAIKVGFGSGFFIRRINHHKSGICLFTLKTF